MTHQQIDQHLEDFAANEATEGMSANAFKLLSVCNVYQKIRPILKFAKSLLFWKPKWQIVIDEFMAVADGICPE